MNLGGCRCVYPAPSIAIDQRMRLNYFIKGLKFKILSLSLSLALSLYLYLSLFSFIFQQHGTVIRFYEIKYIYDNYI